MTFADYIRKKLNLVNAPSTARDPKKAIIKRLGLAFTKSSGSAAKKDFQPSEFDLIEITNAYNTDSYIRQAIDKYVDLMFKAGWDITGKNQNAVDYIKIRLAVMAEATQTPTKQFLLDIAEDLVKYGNAFIIKARVKGQYTLPPGVTATGIAGVDPIAGYFVLPPTTIKIARDENGTIARYQQEVSGKTAIEFKPEDIIHIYWKKERGQAFGVPFLISVLDDVKILRQVEENVIRLIYRHLFPLHVYTVGLPEAGFEATDEEIDLVREEIRNMPLDGGLVVPERHKIEIIGTQGEALDASKYLEYYRKRVFTGLGVSETIMGIGDCYDEATQTLTHKGWKYYWEIGEGDLIATYNPENSMIEYHTPIDGYDSHIFDYTGTMYHIDSKHADIMVSPGHDMWIMTNREKPNWHKVKIEDFYNNGPSEFCVLEGTLGERYYTDDSVFVIPEVEYKYNEGNTNTTFELKEFARLIGYFISEGHLRQSDDRHYPIVISQKKEESLARIIDVLDKLGLKYGISIDDSGTSNITFHHKSLWYWLNENVGHSCYNKRIPRDMLIYSPEVLQAMLDALIDGDGTIDNRVGRTGRCYYTVCDKLADDVQELAVRLGYKVKISKTKQSKNAFSNGFINRVLITTGGKNYRIIKKSDIHPVNYSGKMYCYNVPNHLFVTRRNGKIAIQGNTANRGTAESMTTEMHDRIKAFQRVFAEGIGFYVVSELLREGGFDPLARPEDNVNFTFKEIDLEMQTKIENSVNQLWMGNMVTFEEARQLLGKDPVVDENRLYFKMIGATEIDDQAVADIKVEQSKPQPAAAKPAAKPASKPAKTAASVKEFIYEEFLPVDKYHSVLQYHWELTRSDVIEMVKQYYISKERSFNSFDLKEISGILHLTMNSMLKEAEKYIRPAFIRGVDAARIQVGQGIPNVNYEAGIRELVNYHNSLITRLLDEDLSYQIKVAVRSANSENAIAKIMGAFQALSFRLEFISSSELYRAYNFGFVKCAEVMGCPEVIIKGNDGCETCIAVNGTRVSTINKTVTSPSIPPFHPNCTCLLSIPEER